MTRDELREAMIEAGAETVRKMNGYEYSAKRISEGGLATTDISKAVLGTIDAILKAFPIFYADNSEAVKLAREAAANAVEDVNYGAASTEIRRCHSDNYPSTKVFNAILPFIGRKDTLAEACWLVREIADVPNKGDYYLQIASESSFIGLINDSDFDDDCSSNTDAILAMLKARLAEVTPKPIPTKEEAKAALDRLGGFVPKGDEDFACIRALLDSLK